MRIQEISFAELMTLEPHGPDTYVGVAVSYPWGDRLYGGQVIAQSLRAAAGTVPVDRFVHSLHAYFIRPGTHTEPIRFEVERLRDGRSFSTRQVVARQSGGAILNLSVSFQDDEDEADVPAAAVPEGRPEPDDTGLVDQGWADLLDRRGPRPGDGPPGWWIRLLEDVGDDRVLQSCALSYLSDAAPSRSARSVHPDLVGDSSDRGSFIGASLDHALWFHRTSRVEQWHWFDMRPHGLSGGRGVVSGDVWTSDGRHVATMAQQVLLRRLRHVEAGPTNHVPDVPLRDARGGRNPTPTED